MVGFSTCFSASKQICFRNALFFSLPHWFYMAYGICVVIQAVYLRLSRNEWEEIRTENPLIWMLFIPYTDNPWPPPPPPPSSPYLFNSVSNPKACITHSVIHLSISHKWMSTQVTKSKHVVVHVGFLVLTWDYHLEYEFLPTDVKNSARHF